MSQPAKHVIIVGGGISGLSAAYYLQKRTAEEGFDCTYTVAEKSPRFGGKITTRPRDGFLMESGPDSFITQKPWAHELCMELGLQDRLMGTNDHHRTIFVLNNGKLQTFPDGMKLTVPTKWLPFFQSSILSWPGKLRVAMDLFIPARKGDEDESIAQFIRRRFGRKLLKNWHNRFWLASMWPTLKSSVCWSTFPRLRDMEKKYGSLIRGMRAATRKPAVPDALPMFMSLKGGLSELTDALEQKLTGSLRTQADASKLTRDDASGQWTVQYLNGEEEQADAVILTTPAAHTAELIEPHSSSAAEALRDRYLSSATINLGYHKDELTHPLDGFGFVVPKKESNTLLACTWVSTKFDHRAPEDQVLLRTYVGGYRNQKLVDLKNPELLAVVRSELQKTMGISAEPVTHSIYRWTNSNVQYDVGHRETVEKIEGHIRQGCSGIYLTGSTFRGVGLPDCIHQSKQTVEQLIKNLHPMNPRELEENK